LVSGDLFEEEVVKAVDGIFKIEIGAWEDDCSDDAFDEATFAEDDIIGALDDRDLELSLELCLGLSFDDVSLSLLLRRPRRDIDVLLRPEA